MVDTAAVSLVSPPECGRKLATYVPVEGWTGQGDETAVAFSFSAPSSANSFM